MKTRLHSILFAALAVCSCSQQIQSTRSTIDFVKEIISAKGNHHRTLLEESGEINPRGEIVIIGEDGFCTELAATLAADDSRENVDGSYRPDQLPDFAGETIAVVTDSICSPFLERIAAGDSESVREYAVRNVISTLDTVYHVSPYDLEGIGRRGVAKIIVLADPVLSVYGKYDIDTLFQATSCRIPVISPFETMLSTVPSGAVIGVICREKHAGTDIYASIAAEYARMNGTAACRCFCTAAADTVEVLQHFFDSYVSAGGIEAVEALFVDDLSVDMGGIQSSLDAIRDLSKAESMKYGRLVADRFKTVGAGETVCRACYDALRANNAFTHKVSMPRVVSFYTMLNPSKDDGSTVLIPTSDVQD